MQVSVARRVAASGAVAAMLLGFGSVSAASAAPVTSVSHSAVPAAVPAAAFPQWQKDILTKTEMAEILQVDPAAVETLGADRSKASIAAVYGGAQSDGMKIAGFVEIDRINPSGWKKEVRKFAKSFGFTTVSLSSGSYEGYKVDPDTGTKTYAYVLNAGEGFAITGMSIIDAANDDSAGLGAKMMAQDIAIAQQLKLAKKGYGSLG